MSTSIYTMSDSPIIQIYLDSLLIIVINFYIHNYSISTFTKFLQNGIKR